MLINTVSTPLENIHSALPVYLHLFLMSCNFSILASITVGCNNMITVNCNSLHSRTSKIITVVIINFININNINFMATWSQIVNYVLKFQISIDDFSKLLFLKSDTIWKYFFGLFYQVLTFLINISCFIFIGNNWWWGLGESMAVLMSSCINKYLNAAWKIRIIKIRSILIFRTKLNPVFTPYFLLLSISEVVLSI